MADLLGIKWASIYPSLEGLAQDRVEWFFHVKVKRGITNSEGDNIFESLKRVLNLKQRLKKGRRICERFGKQFQIALSAENIHRETNIHHWFAWKNVLPNLPKNKTEYSLLIINLLFIYENNTTCLYISHPLTFPDGVPVQCFFISDWCRLGGGLKSISVAGEGIADDYISLFIKIAMYLLNGD